MLALVIGWPMAAFSQVLPVAPPETKTPEPAATPAAVPHAVATIDFSGGFQKLIALGLPSLEGAEWITGGDVNGGSMEEYELREVLTGIKGTGWKVQVNGKPMFLQLGAVEATEIPSGESGGGGILGAIFGGGSKKPKAGDLAADANKLISTIGDPDKSKEFRSELEYRGTSGLGRLLIFAAQIHQAGHPTEANKLAAALFSLGPSPESIIDGAINHLATRDLARVTATFFEGHDWAAYEQGLRTLTSRYPRGWETLPAVQILLPTVGKKVAGTPPPTPAIPGITLSPEALAALAETLEATKGAPDEDAIKRYAKENGIPAEVAANPKFREQLLQMMASGGERNSGSLWLIEPPPGPDAKDPWSRLKRLGVDALPALAAVASDESLTLSRNQGSRGGSTFRFRGSRGRGESAADLALQAYQSMDRPQTRGELATRLLASALPAGDMEEAAPQALAEAAVVFWKAHHGQSRLDLLKFFLAEGSTNQKSEAAGVLAEMPDEAARKAFESYVLETENVTDTLNSVSAYLKLHKATAKDFFTRFSARLKSQLEGVDINTLNVGYELRGAGGIDKYLKKLSLLVGGDSPRKLALELAKAPKPDKAQISAIAETTGPQEFVPVFLEAAAAATTLETRAAFLMPLYQNSMSSRRGRSTDQAPADQAVPAAQVPHWTTLLADDRTLPDGTTPSFLAATVMEMLHSSSLLEQMAELYQLDPAGSSKFLISRAKARVAGSPLPPFPNADSVQAAHLDEMVKQLADAKPEAIQSLIGGWSLDEKAAYKKWRINLANRTKIPASVVAARKLLNAPEDLPGAPPAAKSLEVLQSLNLKPGTKVDGDQIISLCNTLAAAAKTHSGLVASFTGSPLDTGFTSAASQEIGSAQNNRGMSAYLLYQVANELQKSKDDTMVMTTWAGEERYNPANRIVWKLNGTTVTPPDAEPLQKFREAAASLDQPDAKPLSFTISVLHRDDIEKVMKAMQSSSEDSSSEDSDDSDK